MNVSRQGTPRQVLEARILHIEGTGHNVSMGAPRVNMCFKFCTISRGRTLLCTHVGTCTFQFSLLPWSYALQLSAFDQVARLKSGLFAQLCASTEQALLKLSIEWEEGIAGGGGEKEENTRMKMPSKLDVQLVQATDDEIHMQSGLNTSLQKWNIHRPPL